MVHPERGGTPLRALLSNQFFSLQGLDLVAGFMLYFAVFCVVGWLIEMTYLGTARQGMINSGFLQGPFIPAFACGTLLIYPFTLLAAMFPVWLQLVLFAILATIIEYMAHWTLEKILGIRIWDYSDEFLHFQGRICLKYTFFWLVLVTLLVYVLQPLAVAFIEHLPRPVLRPLALIMFVIIGADYIYSIRLFGRLSRAITRVCGLMGLESGPLHDLQFNRPRIMNEKKRVKKLLHLAANRELEQTVLPRLFVDRLYLAEPAFQAAIRDIIDHPKFQAWHDHQDNASLTYRQHLRIAELSWRFCQAMGFDATAAARGALLCAYKRCKLSPISHARTVLFPQTTVLQWVTKDLGKTNRVERDIILWYKWPINFKAPATMEALMVSFAAKLVKSLEYRPALAHLYKAELEIAAHG